MSRWRGALGRLPLGTRVGLLVALATGLAVAVTAAVAYVTVRGELLARQDQQLLERARVAAGSPLGDPGRIGEIPAEALSAGDLRAALLRTDGFLIALGGVDRVPPFGAPELAVATGEARQSLRTTAADGREWRVTAVPAGPAWTFVLAVDTAATRAGLARLGLLFLVVGALGIAGATSAGVAVARSALRPVRRLTAAAERAAATGELRPVAVEGEDELARMAAAFNAMLEAVRDSQDRQRQLVADAGHELRTPLTSLRTNLDLLAQSDAAAADGSRPPLPPDERTALLDDVRAQLDELSSLVADLVALSRPAPGQRSSEEVDLADVVRAAVARVRRRAPEVAFSVDVRSSPVAGDPALLERAVTNLLDNAAKWSPPGATVAVSLRDRRLVVDDAGPGIDPGDRTRVFDRFWRAPSARGLPGSGLGLAIVRQVVEQHGGTVVVQTAPTGGARLVLTLPDAQQVLDRLSGSSQPGGAASRA